MIHMNSYFEVDWQASADNLKGLLKGKVTYSVLAEAMCVEPKTVYNWVNNKTAPSINDLVLLAKFLNVDILDILVMKGDREAPLIRDEVISAMNEERKAIDKLVDKNVKNDCPCKESVIATVFLNEYQRQNTKIRNLNEFLLYLPLCDPFRLADVLYRINGNLKHNQEYVEKQLDHLYRWIPESPVKSYADKCRYFYLSPPSVYEINGNTKDPYKIQKIIEYRIWSRDKAMQKAALDYDKKHSEFLKRITGLEGAKTILERFMEDDNF